IIADGMSAAVLINDFAAIYKQKVLPELTIHYKDYVAWQNREKSEKQHEYWRKEFAGEIPVLELPVDYVRPAVQSFAGKSIEFETGTPALESGVTLYQFLLAIYNIFLAKVSNREDIIIGTPVAGRRHADLEKIIGMFINTLALRNYPAGEKRFSDFLFEVKENSLKALENQDYPYEDIIEGTGIKRDTGRNPLFDAAFSLLNFDNAPIEIPGLKLSPAKHENKTAKFDLTLSAIEIENKLAFTFEYCTKLFKNETIERFIIYFKNIINTVIEHKDLRISEIEIIAAEEKNLILYNFNNTSAGYPHQETIHRLFTAQAEKTPDVMALVGADLRVCPNFPISLSYSKLNEQAGLVAGLLIAKGARGGDIVAVIMKRSIEMITGIYGILKAGCAYLPIDPDYPPERIDYMLKDSKARILHFEHLHFAYLNFDIVSNFDSSNSAYIIYTSGSTGKPKGTVIEHHSVINRLHWMQKAYPLSAGDVILQKTPVVFDVSVWELFWWSFQGAGLYLLKPGEEKDPRAIAAAVERYRITTMHFVPSMLNAFLVYFETGEKTAENIDKLKNLKQVFSSGEALAVEHVERFYRLFKKETPPQLINLYGPTEATVDVSYYPCPAGVKLERVPIGKPIANTQLYILNKEQRLQPVGISGELHIAGVGLARGYLNNPELTAEKFINKSFSGGPGGRLFKKAPLVYKTGDLARRLDDGTIEFLGRIDHQVKIRGYRIELGEIENRLLEHPDIRETIVILKGALCAYFVSEKNLTAQQLREYLAHELPDYMVPSSFVQIEKMPLAPGGKIDSKALPEPGIEMTGAAPLDHVEEKLATIWSELLGIEKDRVGANTNFFEIGGHSLKAALLAAGIHKELNVKVPLVEIFKTAELRELANYIKSCGIESYHSLEPVEKKEYYPLSSAQKRLFFLQQMDPEGTSYNIPAAWQITGILDEERLKQTFERLIQRHESLRTSFAIINGEAVQRVHAHVEFKIEYEEGQTRAFDLAKAPLLRVGLNKNILMIDMHHIIADGMSAAVLINDFAAIYKEKVLPELTIHYKDYVAWQNHEKKEKQQEYWRQEFAGEIPVLELPVDYVRPAVQSFAGKSIEFETQIPALENGVTLYQFLLAIYNVFLAKVSNREDIIIGTPVAGRQHADLEKIIGMFINTLALRNYPAGEKRFSDFLFEVKENSLNGLENQDYPYEDI
ncbi:MAG TPA: amino acid adenylation domain-containing protein, partial [Candidatus Deferrimicrobium sp.]|nr:amino acid adenylation domain-containing protein [Candidatus Deferrimicrobium sp.]